MEVKDLKKHIWKVGAGATALIVAGISGYYLFRSKKGDGELNPRYLAVLELVKSDANTLIQIYQKERLLNTGNLVEDQGSL